MSPTALALLFMCLGALLIPVGDACAKAISNVSTLEPITIAFVRFLIGAAIFVPLAVARRQIPRLSRRFVTAQILRGACVAGGITGMVTAVSYAPLADVFGAFFIAPAIATALAMVFLKERVTRGDVLSLALGLCGVLLVTRPDAEMNIGLLWALFAGSCYGAFNAATRWSAGFAPPLAQMAGQLIVGALLTAPLGAAGLSAVGEAPWLLVGSGLASAAANFFLVMAYARERAAVLSPLIYLQLPSAALIGFAAFGEMPDTLAAAGLALIVFAGLGVRLIWGPGGAPPSAGPPPAP
ncbi:MAG: DMT family transporter [Paracoccaceae bacterium]